MFFKKFHLRSSTYKHPHQKLPCYRPGGENPINGFFLSSSPSLLSEWLPCIQVFKSVLYSEIQICTSLSFLRHIWMECPYSSSRHLCEVVKRELWYKRWRVIIIWEILNKPLLASIFSSNCSKIYFLKTMFLIHFPPAFTSLVEKTFSTKLSSEAHSNQITLYFIFLSWPSVMKASLNQWKVQVFPPLC